MDLILIIHLLKYVTLSIINNTIMVRKYFRVYKIFLIYSNLIKASFEYKNVGCIVTKIDLNINVIMINDLFIKVLYKVATGFSQIIIDR